LLDIDMRWRVVPGDLKSWSESSADIPLQAILSEP